MRDVIVGVFAGMLLMVVGWYVFWPVTNKVIDVVNDRVAPPSPIRGTDPASKQIVLGRIIRIERQLGISLTTLRRGQKVELVSLKQWCERSRIKGNCDGSSQPSDFLFRKPYALVARRVHDKIDHVLRYEGKKGKVVLAIYPDKSGKLEWLLHVHDGWQRKATTGLIEQGDLLNKLRLRIWADVKPAQPFEKLFRHDDIFIASDAPVPVDAYRGPAVHIEAVNIDGSGDTLRWDDVDLVTDVIDARYFIFKCLMAPLSEGADSPACVKPAEKSVAEPDASLPAKERKFADRRNRWSRSRTQATRALRGAAPGSMTVEQCAAAGIKDLLRPSDKPDFVDDEFWYQNLVNIVHTTWSQCFEALEGRKGWKETFGARYKRFFDALPSLQKRKAAAAAPKTQEFRPPEVLDTNLSRREFARRRRECISALATYNASTGKNIRSRQGCPRRSDLVDSGNLSRGASMPQLRSSRKRRFAAADGLSDDKHFSAAFHDALRFAQRRPRDRNKIYQFNRRLWRKLRLATVSDFKILKAMSAADQAATAAYLKDFPLGERSHLYGACTGASRRHNRSSDMPVRRTELCDWVMIWKPPGSPRRAGIVRDAENQLLYELRNCITDANRDGRTTEQACERFFAHRKLPRVRPLGRIFDLVKVLETNAPSYRSNLQKQINQLRVVDFSSISGVLKSDPRMRFINPQKDRQFSNRLRQAARRLREPWELSLFLQACLRTAVRPQDSAVCDDLETALQLQ